jgi:hypothetical protein
MGNNNSAVPAPVPVPIPDPVQNQEKPNDMTDMIGVIDMLSNPKNATKDPIKTIGLISRIYSKFSGKKQFGKRTHRKKHKKSRTKSRTKSKRNNKKK